MGRFETLEQKIERLSWQRLQFFGLGICLGIIIGVAIITHTTQGLMENRPAPSQEVQP